jgi:hypothetical protein
VYPRKFAAHLTPREALNPTPTLGVNLNWLNQIETFYKTRGAAMDARDADD